jgi:hypothetical protein
LPLPCGQRSHSKAVGHAETGGFAFIPDQYLKVGIYEMSNRTGEPIARPVQPTKDTLNALARKPVCATMELDHARPPLPAALVSR